MTPNNGAMWNQYKTRFLKVYRGFDEEMFCVLFVQVKRRVRSIGPARVEMKGPGEKRGPDAGLALTEQCGLFRE